MTVPDTLAAASGRLGRLRRLRAAAGTPAFSAVAEQNWGAARGVLPLTFAQESQYELVNGDELEVPGIREGLLCSELTVVNKTRGKEFAVRCSFTPRQVERVWISL